MLILLVLGFFCCLSVFCRVLARGTRLLCLWTSAQGAAAAASSAGSRKRMPAERIVLQVSGGAVNICSSSISIFSGVSIASRHGALIGTRIHCQSSIDRLCGCTCVHLTLVWCSSKNNCRCVVCFISSSCCLLSWQLYLPQSCCCCCCWTIFTSATATTDAIYLAVVLHQKYLLNI